MTTPSRLSRLPSSISHWLGYRSGPVRPPAKPYVWLWSFIGAFCGLSIIQAVFERNSYFTERNVPGVIGSLGASAILCYGAIEAPLAQPRALMCGNFIGALIGICITKFFLLLPPDRFQDLKWLAGSLSVSCAIVVMQITETTHPPAGATALLAAVSQPEIALGWYYLPVIMLSSVLVLVSALLINNIQRRYPVYWISPAVVRIKSDEEKTHPKEEIGGTQRDVMNGHVPVTASVVNSSDDEDDKLRPNSHHRSHSAVSQDDVLNGHVTQTASVSSGSTIARNSKETHA